MVKARLRPSLRLSFDKGAIEDGPGSRLGGAPDLPAEVPWPTHDGEALDFIAQCRLADMGDLGRAHGLPEEGVLAFFYNLDPQPGGYERSDRGSWRVLFIPGEGQPTGARPTPTTSPLEARRLHFEAAASLPPLRQFEALEGGLTDGEYEAYVRLRCH
jgi:uncharacterized protein YwqG